MKYPFTSSPLGIPLEVTSPFGPRDPSIGSSGFHAGVDFRAPDGTPVLAPFDGVAHTFRTGGAGGNICSVIHRDGWVVNMDHLSSFQFIGPRDVASGDLVGLSGHTGQVTGPHLHLELRPPPLPDGSRATLVDPLPFIVGASVAGPLVAAVAIAAKAFF